MVLNPNKLPEKALNNIGKEIAHEDRESTREVLTWAINSENPMNLNSIFSNHKEDPTFWTAINHLSKEQLIAIIKMNTIDISNLYPMLNPINRRILINTILSNPQIEFDYNNFPEELLHKLIKRESSIYKKINHPSEEFTLKAIKENFRVIGYVENPTDDQQVAALMQDERAIYAIIHYGKKDFNYGPKASQLITVWRNQWNYTYWLDELENPCKEAIQLAENLQAEKAQREKELED